MLMALLPTKVSPLLKRRSPINTKVMGLPVPIAAIRGTRMASLASGKSIAGPCRLETHTFDGFIA